MVKLSKRIEKVSPSMTLAITAKAKKLKQEGEDVISFGAGETDFDTPDFIKNEAIESLKNGFTRYTPASGIIELKKAIQHKFKKENNLEYDIDEIIVSCGAKHSLYNIFQVLCDEGDEVLLSSPYWVSYPPQIELAGAKPVFLDTSHNDFFIDVEELESKITDKTKVFLLNNPSNPTGVFYNKKFLSRIAEVLEDKDIWIISDEIYEHLVYTDDEYVSFASLSEKIKQKTIVVNGVSKSYAMTGWRIGYAAGNKEIISAINRLQSHSTSNPVSFAQKGAVKALLEGDSFISQLKSVFGKRRDLIYNLLSDIKGIDVKKPEGSFYIFPDVSSLYGKKYKDNVINSSFDFADLLLKYEKVATVPGIAFGNDKFIRLSYALSEENIKEGISRIKNFIENLI